MSFLKSWLFGTSLPVVTLSDKNETESKIEVEVKSETEAKDKIYPINELATLVKKFKNNILSLSFNLIDKETPVEVNLEKKQEYNFMKNKILYIHLSQLLKKEYNIIINENTTFKLLN